MLKVRVWSWTTLAVRVYVCGVSWKFSVPGDRLVARTPSFPVPPNKLTSHHSRLSLSQAARSFERAESVLGCANTSSC